MDDPQLSQQIELRKARFARGLEQLLLRRTDGNTAGAEQTEGALADLSLRFLRLHIEGVEPLPRDVATFVFRLLDDALSGHPAACLTHKIGGKNKSREEFTAEAWAVSCIRHSRAGRIAGFTVPAIANLYGVHEKTVRRWEKEEYPDTLGKHLDELPTNVDPTVYAQSHLERLAALHKARRAKS